METPDGGEIVAFADAAGWEAWLAAHHDQRACVWLKVAKKGAATPSVTIGDALDVALCYGWIDGQRRSLDDTHYLQRYSPRRPRSSWSQVNTAKVAALVAAGRMQAPGHAQVAAAKADGRWAAAYVSQRHATAPPDLAAALAQNDAAQRAFDALTKTERYAAILRLHRARTAVTRAAHLARIVAALDPGDVAQESPASLADR